MNMEKNEELRGYPEFTRMPQQIREWVQASSQATADFAGFFKKGGTIEPNPAVKYAEYVATDPPVMRVNEENWEKALAPDAMAWPQRRMMGVLAHEIGHTRFNTGSVPFTGKTAEEYVQYRSGLEAQATFNAFPILKDLEELPEFKDKPFGSIGYLNELELGALYGEWKAGRLDDAAVVKQMTPKIADAPYTLPNPPQDMNRDGVIAHRDNYLRDFEQYVKPKLEPQSSIDEPLKLFEPDKALGDKLRGLVGTLDQQVKKDWSDSSERVWGAAFAMGTEKKFTGQDDLQLALNGQTGKHVAGEILHLSRSGPNSSIDPYENRANKPMADVLSVPADEWLRQVQTIGQSQAEQQRLAQQQELTKGSDDPTKGGPKFTM